MIVGMLFFWLCVISMAIGAYVWEKRREARKEQSEAERGRVMTCTVDSQCPAGYVCIDGKCVPAT
jgi:Cys-rich repeat protein